MARGRKPAPAPSNVTKDTFLEFLTTVDNTKQRVSDAQMLYAREVKKSESLGIHTEAMKSIQKLAKMSEDKRNDYWRSLVKYYGWKFGEQLDLLETASDADDAQIGDDDDYADDLPSPFGSSDEDDAEDGPAPLNFDEPRERSDDPMLEETTEAWDDADGADLDSDALDSTAQVFQVGREAGLAGEDGNPYEEGTQAAEIWERGRVSGVAERAVALEALGIAEEIGGEEERSSTVVSLFGDGEQGDEIHPATVGGADIAPSHTAA